MIEASASISIQAPVQKVFEITADPRKQLEWDSRNFSQLQALNDQPLGRGSKFSCHVRGMGKMIYEFSEYEPYNKFVHTSETRMAWGIHDFNFTPSGDSTLFSQTMKLRLRGLAILLYLFVRWKLKKQLIAMNTELKKYIEKDSG